MKNAPSIFFLKKVFVREIPPKLSGSFGCYRHEWVNVICMAFYSFSHKGMLKYHVEITLFTVKLIQAVMY